LMGEVRRRAGRPGSQLRRGPARVRRYRVAPRTPGCAAQLLAQLAEAGATSPPDARARTRRSAPLPGTTGVFPASAEVDASVVGTDSGPPHVVAAAVRSCRAALRARCLDASVRRVTAAPESPAEDAVQRIAAGYAVSGPALELGAVVVGGTPHASAQVRVPLSMLNRHGLIAGATGTGKTKTLQVIAEQLSSAGVPVVLADVKGDLSGLATAGTSGDRVVTRAAQTGDDWTPTAFPVEFLSLGGIGPGIPVRATMTGFGPTLLSKVLDLNPTQESSLGLIFHYADRAGLPLLDLKDLRAVVSWLISDEGKPELKDLGGLSAATAGVILRELIGLEELGGDVFFGEPEWEPP